jgi:mono/diheme cytochrome c family protein/plastocyanin
METMKQNWVALLIVIAILVLLPAAIFGHRAAQGAADGLRVIEIEARAPDVGGFVPDRLELTAGETVKLRITSPDVVHGFNIPQLGVDIAEIYPGKPVEVVVTAPQPGRYAFACTRWCGLDHWRMRGVIEVVAGPVAGQDQAEASQPAPSAAPEKPLFERLGIDLDAMRHAAGSLPQQPPSASRGAALANRTLASVSDVATEYAGRALSPVDAFSRLRDAAENAGLSDDEVWDLVAWMWLRDAPAEALGRAESLYARDCAACHGERGQGDGIAGKDLPGMAKMDPNMPRGPADFTDGGQMLSAPDALLHGKILRGGMGTGMPEFGSLYTDEELWAMVSYLRTFLFTK